MEHAKDPRHGKQLPVDPNIINEIMKRTWIAIDRFFHFRLDGGKRLDLKKFPLLP